MMAGTSAVVVGAYVLALSVTDPSTASVLGNTHIIDALRGSDLGPDLLALWGANLLWDRPA
jgi:hypothetical protein